MILPRWCLSKKVPFPLSLEQSVSLRFKRRFIASTCRSLRNERENSRIKDEPSSNDWQAERDLILSVLSTSTTRRDAKSYLTRFKPPTGNGSDAAGLNSNLLHVALVKIRAPQTLTNTVVAGLAQTLAQLDRLGLNSIVVTDCTQDGEHGAVLSDRATNIAQAARLVSAIQKNNGTRARRLDYVLGVSPKSDASLSSNPLVGTVSVEQAKVLFRTLTAGTIPVIPPIAYATDTQRATVVESDEVLLALTRQFVRSEGTASGTENQKQTLNLASQSTEWPRRCINVERIIVLDPLGPLPSTTRPNKTHVFVNLEQEYRDIKQELQSGNSSRHDHQSIGQSDISPDNERHLQNLLLLQKTLSLLPSSSSALLTSPSEAATFRPSDTSSTEYLGVGTRRPKNPLIFNLLTDKPLVSSSLPASRLIYNRKSSYIQTGEATVVKRGVSLTMIPDPRHEAWEPPRPDQHCLTLDDPRLDFARLLNLMEDSFNRPLDVEHYTKRIRNKIAGIIVAGEYEGGALLTWELPPGVPDDGSEASRLRMVPYLDKFAVLKRSQGAGGVADIVFSAMVRTCFPQGVCWRSRKSNPVNKWYFERSVGTLKLPDSMWSMFWTTNGLLEDKQKLLDYEGVCRSVEPSWADQKHPD